MRVQSGHLLCLEDFLCLSLEANLSVVFLGVTGLEVDGERCRPLNLQLSHFRPVDLFAVIVKPRRENSKVLGKRLEVQKLVGFQRLDHVWLCFSRKAKDWLQLRGQKYLASLRKSGRNGTVGRVALALTMIGLKVMYGDLRNVYAPVNEIQKHAGENGVFVLSRTTIAEQRDRFLSLGVFC